MTPTTRWKCTRTYNDLRTALEDIAAFHVSNCGAASHADQRGLPAFHQHGSIDFRKVVRILKEGEWRGILDLEYHRPWRDDVDLLVSDARRFESLLL